MYKNNRQYTQHRTTYVPFSSWTSRHPKTMIACAVVTAIVGSLLASLV